MEENYYTAPLRLPDPPRKRIPWLTVNTSPTTLYGDRQPEAVERKYFGNTSPPPSLCSCGNCADYPDAEDLNAEVLDDETHDAETLNNHHQAKRDAIPRGKRARAKLGCLYADPRYMSDPEVETEVPAPATDDDASGQGNVGPNEAFPVFIDDNLNIHDYFSCHFDVPNPQEQNNDDQSDEKASDVTHRHRTYPKTPAPTPSRKSRDSYEEPDLDFVLNTALQTANKLQSAAEDTGRIAHRLQGQLAIVRFGIDSKKATSVGTRPHQPLSAVFVVVWELVCTIGVVFCTLAFVVNTNQYVSIQSDAPALWTCDSFLSMRCNQMLLSVNIGLTVARVSLTIWSILGRRGSSNSDDNSGLLHTMNPEPAQKQADPNTIIDDDGF